ncbi:MAG: hypothetical protein KDD94_02975 [Calditrichaeota bacterium]|nr:hypothetical protein [Calditrichota bacterium]
MDKFHFYYGCCLFLVFIATGVFMHVEYNHMTGIADGPRMMFRSAHIFILFTAALNILYGRIKSSHPLFYRIESTALILSPALFIYSFFIESESSILHRPASKYAIYLILLLIISNVIGHFKRRSS